MGNITKIDWCDASWNPVTGCLHGCEYCYAQGIAKRFGGVYYEDELPNRYGEYEVERLSADGDLHELNYPLRNYGNNKIAPYPFEFDPTIHRYKLDEPQHWKKPRNIFVCSMADLFGEWVPNADAVAKKATATESTESVRRGRMVEKTFWYSNGWGDIYTLYECCGHRETGKRHDNFCPNCGAIMEMVDKKEEHK